MRISDWSSDVCSSDLLHSIPLAKWRDAAVLHERLLTGHSTAPDKDRQSLMSLVEKHPLLGDFLPSRPRVKSKEMLAMQYAAEAARATYDEKSDELPSGNHIRGDSRRCTGKQNGRASCRERV